MRALVGARWLSIALVAVALVTGLAGLSPLPEPEPTPEKSLAPASPWPIPRLMVFIIIDTLRADHLGTYGDQRHLTPALDRLAERSYVFEKATATSSWTRSSIASAMTSRYPSALQVLRREDTIAEEVLTLAEVLSSHGWQTAGVFTNGNASPELGFAQGFDQILSSQRVRGYPNDFQKITAEGVSEEALLALQRWRGSGSDSRLFLFVHYIDPHDPYLPHPEQDPAPAPGGRFTGARSDLLRLDRLRSWQREAADVARIKHLYAGEVRYCDGWVGALLDALSVPGQADETLVIVTADHGEGLWDHGKRGHGGDLYQEQVHVPLLIHYPGMEEANGRRIAAPVSLLDLAPTMLAAAGIEPPSAFEGHDLRRLVNAPRSAPAPSFVYAEMDLDGRNFEAIRLGSSKLVRRRGPWALLLPGTQLFDLESDPHESANVVREQHYRTMARRLTIAADRRPAGRPQSGDHRRPPMHEMSPILREQLRGLGYVQ